MSGATAPLPPHSQCYDIPRLLQLFESLGENCDLGVVQRAIGLEPLGLFRFGACDAAGVLALLRARFHPLCEPEDLWLDEVGPRREYWVKSRQFAFESHTNRYAPQDEAAVVRRGELERLRYLKSHLLRDLASGRKLFVFKGNSDLATIRRLATQLQDYGTNCLLWLNVADKAHAPGSVERDSTALLRGYLSRFGTYDGDPSLPVEEWVTVCANAYRLWRNEEPPRKLLDNLLAEADATGSCQWLVAPPAATRALTDPAVAGGVTYEHRLATDEPTIVCRAALRISVGGNFVFSAWVRIPEACHARQISLLLPGFSSVASWPVDLKSRRWQRAWISASLPSGAPTIACELVGACAAGEAFYSTSWCLERGTRPGGFGFAL